MMKIYYESGKKKSSLFEAGSAWLAGDAAGWVSKWRMRKTEKYIQAFLSPPKYFTQ